MRGFRTWKQRLLGISAAALVLPTAAGVACAAVAAAAPVHQAPAGGYKELLVPSSMGPIKVQVQFAKNGGGAALYLLDGMRARDDWNAWSQSFDQGGGNARAEFANDNINLVMPVGGVSSWYTDWYSPSNFNGQQVTYKWETFLTKELPTYLAKYGVSPVDDGIVGLSMSGSSALTLAAYHRDQFKFASCMSGMPNLAAPGMRTAMRVAELGVGGYNVDNMWGPPWSPAWSRNDPFQFASKLQGLSMFISSGDGVPQLGDFQMGLGNMINAWGLETLSNIETHAFEIKMTSIGVPATYDFGWAGVHSWAYWSTELWRARPQILQALGA